MEPSRVGGVVVRHGEALRFVPASAVLEITTCPPISRVPGAPASMLGIVHASGRIVPVVGIDDATDARSSTPLLVCRHDGEPVGLLGCDIVEVGMFDAEQAQGVVVDGAMVSPLDLDATFARLDQGRWTALGGIGG